jgi:hypothetical protein
LAGVAALIVLGIGPLFAKAQKPAKPEAQKTEVAPRAATRVARLNLGRVALPDEIAAWDT